MPRGTGPRSRDAAVAVGTVVAPAVDGGARGPRDARRRDLARRPGRSPEATSARTSSRTEPTAAWRNSTLSARTMLAGTGHTRAWPCAKHYVDARVVVNAHAPISVGHGPQCAPFMISHDALRRLAPFHVVRCRATIHRGRGDATRRRSSGETSSATRFRCGPDPAGRILRIASRPARGPC